jgi:uncharacterized protein YbjT (DUF2867 family)
MRIIVLGASGQLGSIIFNSLKQKHDVLGTSRSSHGYFKFDPFRDNWSKLSQADVLVNCIGQINPTRSTSFYKIDVDLAKLIIKNRDVMGNPKIIQISALGASPVHPVEFLRTKGIADTFLLQSPNTSIVRPSIVCTPRTMIVRKMLMLLRFATYSQIIPVPKGFLKTQIQPLMPQDLIAVVEQLCIDPKSSGIINVVGPQRFDFAEIIDLMFETQRKNYRLIEIPKEVTNVIVKYGVSLFFPSIINWQQYQLLFEDNVGESSQVYRTIGRALTPTREFFINEFSYATN